jgi:hypothetical protein
MGLLDDAIREHLDLKRKRGADPGEIERLEREALGPVRRDRSFRDIDSVPHLEVHTEPEHNDFHLEESPTELHQPVEADLEAPVEHAPAEAAPAPPADPAPEPKRGFLRRSRPASLADAGPTDFTQHLDAELHEDHPTEAHVVHPVEDVAPQAPEPQPEPPHLTFDSPLPQRPHFTTQPPEPEHSADEEPQHEQAHAAPPPPAPAAPLPFDEEDEPGATSEWDVEDAFASEETHASSSQAPADEDVLEETPEFLQDTPDHDRLWFEQRPPRDFDFDG